MANKVYEAKTLVSAAKTRADEYQELKRQMNHVKRSMQSLINLDGFHGKGAEAIKGFYQAQIDVVNEWVHLIDKNIAFLKGIPGTEEDFDLAGNTEVHVPFVEEDVSNGITRAKEMVSEQHRELKGTFRQIDDLISLTPFSKESFHSQIEDAEKKRSETVKELNEMDRALKEEYEMLESDEAIVTTLYQQLLASTGSGGNVTSIHFDAKAYHNSEIYKIREENAARHEEYIEFKQEQIEQRRLAKEQEELENRSWQEKTWDATCTFTGEISGYYDFKRATEGVDPVTGEKLTTAERVAAGAMAAAGFIPVVGWAGRAIKGGSAIYKTAKGLNAANHALDAYKSTKGMDILQKSEMGIYGLLAANGFGEAATGRDMFGNKLSDEKRTQSLTNALGITAVGGLARYVDHVQTRNKLPYIEISQEFSMKNGNVTSDVTKESSGSSKGEFGFDVTSEMKGFRHQIDNELKKHGITPGEFNDLKLKSVSELTDAEVKIMKDFRDAVPPIKENTLLQKTIPSSDIENYLSGKYTEIGGYIAKAEDVGHINNYGDVVESFRLDYSFPDGTRPFPADGDSYGMIRFKTKEIDEIEIPYGERFSGTNTDGPPCTQNGFTGSRNGEIVPEWKFTSGQRFSPEDGAELYKVSAGEEKLLGVFDATLGKFIKP
ncbi:T7SS effector LXG polymorphic toxin [Bacillus gobiensis]|uniref:ribonuclease YeeF family protein n=1 Tax=Bacillus gobiensis TaxID=1441095 RepID=UPI003D20E209